MAKNIYITDADLNRLKELIQNVRDFKREEERHLKELEGELGRAHVVPAEEIPDNVITMNSRAVLRDMDTGEELEYSLVFPRDADPDQQKISVLTPIGTAMLGYNAGEVIEWAVPAGTVRLMVDKILYQPEAAGHFHL